MDDLSVGPFRGALGELRRDLSIRLRPAFGIPRRAWSLNANRTSAQAERSGFRFRISSGSSGNEWPTITAWAEIGISCKSCGELAWRSIHSVPSLAQLGQLIEKAEEAHNCGHR